MKKFLSLGLICPLFVFAQEKVLDPVTVVSSLQQQRSSATGRNIYIIRAEQIRDMPAQSLDELLRYLPGVEIQLRGSAGSQGDLLMRGGTFQQVLVLLDGVRINDPLTGHFNSYIPVALAEIERIEILKGPASSLYGSDAVGGVISILTKTFSRKNQQPVREYKGQFTMGAFGLISGEAGAYWHSGKTALGAGLLVNNANGQPQRGTDGFYHNHSFSASVSRSIGEHLNISFRSSLDNRHFAAQNFYTSFLSDTATEQVKSWWNQLQLVYSKGKHRIAWQSAYKQGRDEYYFRAGAIPNMNESGLLQSQVHYNYVFNETSNLVLGTQFIKKSIQSNDRGAHQVSQSGSFFALHKEWGRWSVNPSLRWDWNEISGAQWIPQFSFSYRGGQWVWRGGIGKATRDADFTERYNNYNKSLVSSGNIGNPALQTEKAISWESGFDFIGGNNWKWSTTYFQKNYKELIDWVFTPFANMPRTSNLLNTGSYFLASNVSSFRTKGIESDVSWNKIISEHSSCWGAAGITWMETPSNASLYLSSHARWLANYSVQFKTGDWKYAVNGLYKFRDQQIGNTALVPVTKEYYLMNLKVETKIAKTRSWAFVQCDNLFNKTVADRFGVPLPGRWLMAGIRVY